MKRLLQFAVAGAMVAARMVRNRQSSSTSPGRGPPARTNAPTCSSRRDAGSRLSFTALSDQNGGGFIVEVDRLRGCPLQDQN